MLQPAAHAAQQDEPAVSPVQTLPQGVDHIGVILGNRELHHVGVVGPTAQRVKVAHHQIGRHAIGLQRLIALVGGDEKILRPRVRAQRPGQGHSPYNITDGWIQAGFPLCFDPGLFGWPDQLRRCRLTVRYICFYYNAGSGFGQRNFAPRAGFLLLSGRSRPPQHETFCPLHEPKAENAGSGELI